jgi:sulfite reductase alpha subunit-like flavoprotein
MRPLGNAPLFIHYYSSESTIDSWVADMIKYTTSHYQKKVALTNVSSLSRTENQGNENVQQSVYSLDDKDISGITSELTGSSADSPIEPLYLQIDFESVHNIQRLSGLAKITDGILTLDLKAPSTEVRPIHPLIVPEKVSEFNQNEPGIAKITSVRCLTGKKALSRVIELQLDITNLKWKYQAGDAIGIYCPNHESLVQRLLIRLNYDRDQCFQLKPKSDQSSEVLPFRTPRPVTCYDTLKYLIDLQAFPKRAFFRILSKHCQKETEAKYLLFLASTEGTAALKRLRAERPNLLDIFKAFPSVKTIPLSLLLEYSTRLPPRYYSIANSSLNSPNRVYIAFNIQESEMKGRSVRGLCTGWLDDLVNHPSVRYETISIDSISIPVFPKPESSITMRHPTDPLIPIIMICAGTGITPFFGMLENIVKLDTDLNIRDSLASLSAIKPKRKIWLIYGTRYSGDDGDVLYEKKIRQMAECHIITKLTLALSREGPQKRYVQDEIKQESTEFLQWIQQDAIVYVCGSTALAKDVHTTLVSLVNVEFWVEKTQKRQYIREIWG